MQEDQRNMFLAIALSLGVVMLWQMFLVPDPVDPEELAAMEQAGALLDDSGIPYPQGTAANPSPDSVGSVIIDRDAALRLSRRVEIDAPGVDGSISLTGGRFDDLHLRDYHEEVDPTSPEITLLSPSSSEESYYAEFGWISATRTPGEVPGRTSVWAMADPNAVLTPETPITLLWSNGAGLSFLREISIDDDFMFTVTQTAINSTNHAVTLHPYGLVARRGEPEGRRIWISYEGPFGYLDGQRRSESYKDLREDGEVNYTSSDGWVGITDKYFMTALAPASGHEFEGRFTSRESNGGEIFQSAYVVNPQVIAPGGSIEVSTYFFAGAKEVSLIDQYRDEFGIQRFDLTVDWGWLFFLTKPFFWALLYLKGLVGNFGVAILMFTVLIKILFFPLANKSYESMSKMRKVQPQMEEIRERWADDKVKQQQETMELYKREKLNPLAGCLPMLLQIPVFFALYQVLFVTIEMRHAPFFGWIHDLSAPDPTALFNLFGLLPWSVESMAAVPFIGGILTIGIWPLIMGFSMWFQMQLNPPPPDPMQRRMFALMPIFFTFLLANFAAGLVIYWAWNNSLSILQQSIIMKRMGVSVNPLERIKLPGFIRNAFGGSAPVKVEETQPEPEAPAASTEPEADQDDVAEDAIVEDNDDDNNEDEDDWDDGTDDPLEDDADEDDGSDDNGSEDDGPEDGPKKDAD